MTTDSPAQHTADLVLQKSACMLALELRQGALSLTGRKLYNLLLWQARHLNAKGLRCPDGFFELPVSRLLAGHDIGIAGRSERIRQYVKQMQQTLVEIRVLSEGDETRTGLVDEERVFPLVSEVHYGKRGREPWLRWCFAPTVTEHLLSPDRWANLRLSSISKLSTYTAVALYEICARYAAIGQTSRHPPDFWSVVLRESRGEKVREWRKVKHEFVQPAVAEICLVTEIDIELVEHMRGRAVGEVQFLVRRKAGPSATDVASDEPLPVDVRLVSRAEGLGVREADVDALLSSYSAHAIDQALDAMQAQLTAGHAVAQRAAYLRSILANRHPAGEVRQPVTSAEAAAAPVALQLAQSPSATAIAAPSPEQLHSERLRQAHLAFEALSPEQRAEWIQRTLQTPGGRLPLYRRRLEAGQWESPLVRPLVLEVFISGSGGTP